MNRVLGISLSVVLGLGAVCFTGCNKEEAKQDEQKVKDEAQKAEVKIKEEADKVKDEAAKAEVAMKADAEKVKAKADQLAADAKTRMAHSPTTVPSSRP